MIRRSETRCFYSINDRRLEILDLTPASQAVINERYKCAACWHLSRWWHDHPEPISVVVDRVTPAWVESIGDIALVALDAELLDVLAPYSGDMFCGEVVLDQGSGELQSTRFVTVAAPAARRIQSDRGRYCVHTHWECCDVYTNAIGWASGAIVERTLDNRLVYVDQDGRILVADELIKMLELTRRFPRLWLERIDVVTEPLDNETLPGDPEWDGVLRRKYNALLNVVAYIPHCSRDRQQEQRMFSELRQRLDREVLAVGAEEVHRDSGGDGSCVLHTRGQDTESLRGAVLRALGGWNVSAQFSVSLHRIDSLGTTEVEHLTIMPNSADAEKLLDDWDRGVSEQKPGSNS